MHIQRMDKFNVVISNHTNLIEFKESSKFVLGSLYPQVFNLIKILLRSSKKDKNMNLTNIYTCFLDNSY